MNTLELARQHFLSALEALEAGACPAAITLFEQAAALAPDRVSIQVNLAAALLRNDQPQEAERRSRALLEAQGPLPEALLNLGAALLAQHRYPEAVAAFTTLLAQQPDHLDARLNLCQTLIASGQAAQVLELRTDDAPELQIACAKALIELGRHAEALARSEAALRTASGKPAIRADHAAILAALGRADAAIASLQALSSEHPDYARGWLLLAQRLSAAFRFDEALTACRSGLACSDEKVALLSLEGVLLHRMKQPEAALERFTAALELAPNQADLLGVAHHMALQCCNWEDYASRTETIHARIAAGSQAIEPFCFLVTPATAAQQRRCAEISVRSQFSTLPDARWRRQTFLHPRLRLGYFSADLHDHATAWLMARVFELHDRSRFEVHAFSFGPPEEGGFRQRLRRGIEHFHECHGMSAAQIAALARSQEIDIAIDLKGYTTDSRAEIFARRAAPLQVNYLGYPGTLAHPCYDYLIADAAVIPHGAEGDYSEQIARLPHSYQANDALREVSPHTPSRRALGLPEHGRVLCCFNNSFKLCPQVFAIWMRLLHAHPDSVLWLLGDNPAACANLRREAQRAGIAPERLVFAARTGMPEHLARQRQADLFLDTFHYNAHTTASDALWVGLPVLTCAGQTFAARVGASLLTAAGLPELITHSPADYEAQALALLAAPDTLAALRARLLQENARSPLFDSARFTRNLEAMLLHMQARQIAGVPPQQFDQADQG